MRGADRVGGGGAPPLAQARNQIGPLRGRAAKGLIRDLADAFLGVYGPPPRSPGLRTRAQARDSGRAEPARGRRSGRGGASEEPRKGTSTVARSRPTASSRPRCRLPPAPAAEGSGGGLADPVQAQSPGCGERSSLASARGPPPRARWGSGWARAGRILRVTGCVAAPGALPAPSASARTGNPKTRARGRAISGPAWLSLARSQEVLGMSLN
ncbi:uncharacterized protein LOC119511642 [Choloepus didactylus]|uniref:uncharacterized protein LOC119511642 n=1 Tax=Choloepus didactylus TaxID=27675 RepID=UPI0018A095F1|nr:uncharacterized protein LOC119511642 [Choloepus didactylus]XP_037662074.1 uncharacterized protein LOC119511642 [Choloepus didactylus]XP_037662075.1 uncharacterized protein LOC119511642 [Choloepus didactylus]XP_037662076.1 uncharacterized protein LOC119511642 [Choloepus didactylus]XP_037662077.1 uncharacterized protein LOC119511642 [Choloepus didactylus]